jgi:hypothetical protein
VHDSGNTKLAARGRARSKITLPTNFLTLISLHQSQDTFLICVTVVELKTFENVAKMAET